MEAVPYYIDDSKKVEGEDAYGQIFLSELDSRSIIEFETFQKLNEFMRIGHLTYVDEHQKLDPLFGKTLAGIYVTVTQSQLIMPDTAIPGF